MDGIDGEPKLIIKDLFIGDHRNGGVTCKDGFLYFALGLPSNSGFADPDNHGWTDIPEDPYWVIHDTEGHGTTPHDPPCRDIEHTGLNVRSSDGRLTGAYLPVGVPAEPGMMIPAKTPCGGSVMRVAIDGAGEDGIYAHDSMEVYAMGFRNQSGVEFGPKGSKFENALAVSDNGANDLGNRRVANGAEKLWIVTEKGQDAGFPDKEGFLFVTGKRYGHETFNGSMIDRPIRTSISARNPSCRRAGPIASGITSTAIAACLDRRQSQPGRLHQPGPGMGHQQPDRRYHLERFRLRC